MTKQESFKMEGKITKILPNYMYKIKLENEEEILAYTTGKMKRFRIKCIVGDTVELEMSPYDLTRGRVIKRL